MAYRLTRRAAVAEVDTFEHARRFGVLWPMRSYERLVHPLPLPVHDWNAAQAYARAPMQ